MCFYQDTQILSKRIFSNLGSWEDTHDTKSANLTKSDSDTPVSDTLVKKKKILDHRAPGLFEHLTKLSHDDNSTEVTSVGSEHEPEEFKPLLHIPIPRKPSTSLESASNLSKTVSVPSSKASESSSGKEELKSSKSSFEEDQQQKILQLLLQNTIMLNNSMIQNDGMRRMVGDCKDALSYMKEFNRDCHKNQLERIEKIKEEKKNTGVYNSNPIGEVLFNHLFGSGKIYKYELVLDGELPQPIFRERNITIKVKLVDTLTRESVKHDNKVTLNLFLQTWEVPSTPIQRNKAGNKAVMGETEVEVKDGEAVFERIQINEVTSKFIHGHVAMVILPTKPLNHGTSLTDHCQSTDYINYEDVKPLMLEKVVVKSKKKNSTKKNEK